MVQVIAGRDPTSASLADCIDALRSWRFEPEDEVSLAHGAHWLWRLGNDRSFLGDLLITRLVDGVTTGRALSAPANHVALAECADAGFRLFATIWPAADSPVAEGVFLVADYGRAHDHPVDVLTLGYFGPGTMREHFEEQGEPAPAIPGQPARLRPAGQMALGEGCMLHYRARRDIHRIHPPGSLSVSLSLAHTPPDGRHGRRRYFNSARGHVEGVEGATSTSALMRAALALGGEGMRERAVTMGKSHKVERIRWQVWDALAEQAATPEERDAIWRQAEMSGGRWLADLAQTQRKLL